MISVFLAALKSAEDVAREAAYIESKDHRDHAGIYEIHPARFHLCSRGDIAERCASAHATMTATPRRSGHKWEKAIARHFTFSLPRGVRLTAAEQEAAIDAIIEVVCPSSPAAAARHTPLVEGVGEDGKERCEHLHLLVAEAMTDGRHRLTEQRQRMHCSGEQGLLRLATAQAVEAVNVIRRREGREFLATPDKAVEAARARRREVKGYKFTPLPLIVADALGPGERVDEAAVIDTLRGLGWKVAKKPASARVALTAPGGVRQFSRDLGRLIEDAAEALTERRERAKKDIAGIAHQHVAKQPERTESGPEVSQ